MRSKTEIALVWSVPGYELIQMKREDGGFDLPEAKPLWETESLKYEAALEAHNLEAMRVRSLLSLSSFELHTAHRLWVLYMYIIYNGVCPINK